MDGSSRGKPGREVAVSGWKLGLARMIGLAPEPPLRKRNWPDGVLDDAPVGIAITSLDGKILQSNRTLAALLGVAVETMAGRQVDALFAAASRGAVQQMRASGRGADMPASIEARLAADGRERVVLLHSGRCRRRPKTSPERWLSISST